MRGVLAGGTALTVRVATKMNKPLLIVELNAPANPGMVREWLVRSGIRTLNVAGPRESQARGIYRQARHFLEILLDKKPPART
jgi:hypothetical protein